jgi:predicted small secreted protein
LSNKLKVIALLLLVSFLSGCNGTTGSGNQETTMQDNGQPVNTTSEPIAEAKNLPSAKGGAVRIARWSRNPNGPSMAAVLVGKLGIVKNCLVVNNEDAPPTLLIFPYGTGVWDDAKRRFTYAGKVIGIGKPIKVGGGTINPNLDYLKGTGKYDVPDCGTTNLFLVSDVLAN